MRRKLCTMAGVEAQQWPAVKNQVSPIIDPPQ